MNHSNTLRCARLAAQTADEKKGEDILLLDVRGQSSLTDYFLFITGTSHVHVRAIEDSIRHALKDSGAFLRRTDGQRGHVWRALDYGSFIIHVLDTKTREFYSMERLWEKARIVDLEFNQPKTLPPKKKPAVKKKLTKKAPVASRKKKSR